MKHLALLGLLFTFSVPALSQSVVINELMASNDTTLADPDFGEYGDWIELYNASESVFNLGGSFLTDDIDEPMQWRIPDGTTLAPGAFLLVWTDDGDTALTDLHANFKLSAGGELVGLFDASGIIIDTLSFQDQTTDISFGRYPDGTDTFAFFAEATPEAANDTDPIFGIVEAPSFSLPSGFYEAPDSTAISSAPGTTIRYTLDGSEPTESSILYSEPIQFNETTVVRAAAFAEDYEPSDVVSRAYFVGESSELPVVSLITDPAGFFSDEDGIYVEGTNGIPGRCRTDPVNWNQDWEREVHLTFFEPDGTGGHTIALEHGAGVQIFGGCSRIYPQKSLSLHARSEYGSSDFAYQFFEDVDIDSFDDLVLRSSAQDWWRTMFRDGMIQTLTRHMDLDGQAYRPTVVFLNGEYWGIHNLREKLNEDYVAGHYGYDDDDVELIEGTWSGESDNYDELNALLEGDLNSPELFSQIEARMDVDQYLSYLVAEIYSANADWPGNNLKLWRPMTEDGRWRWMFFDADFGYGGNANGQSDSNTLELATEPNASGWPNPPWSTYLFRRLLTNDDFRHAFIQRMAAHASTTFDPQRTLELIDSLATNIASEIPRHMARWPQSISFGATWDSQVDIMRDFASERPVAVRGHLSDYFEEVTGSARLTLTTESGGTVTAEGVPMEPFDNLRSAESVFEPILYRGVPVELVATPDQGYIFLGWSGLVDTVSDTISVVLTGSASLTANFAIETSVNEPDIPSSLSMEIYPVPATSSATVEINLAEQSRLTVRVIDILGRQVISLSNVDGEAGTQRIKMDTSLLPSGSYFVTIETENSRLTRRLVILR